jgi:Ca2+-binding EF-hand superfamily protein
MSALVLNRPVTLRATSDPSSSFVGVLRAGARLRVTAREHRAVQGASGIERRLVRLAVAELVAGGPAPPDAQGQVGLRGWITEEQALSVFTSGTRHLLELAKEDKPLIPVSDVELRSLGLGDNDAKVDIERGTGAEIEALIPAPPEPSSHGHSSDKDMPRTKSWGARQVANLLHEDEVRHSSPAAPLPGQLMHVGVSGPGRTGILRAGSSGSPKALRHRTVSFGGQTDYQWRAQARQAFDAIDTDRSGYVDRDELQTLLARVGVHQAEELQQAMREMDPNGDDSISFEEFAVWLRQRVMDPGNAKSQAWRALQKLNFEGRLGQSLGVVPRRQSLKMMVKKKKESATTLRQVFKEMDTEATGWLSKAEFAHMVYKMDGKAMKTKALTEVFNRLSKTNSETGEHYIDFETFESWFLERLGSDVRSARVLARQLFVNSDEDRSGSLSKAEVARIEAKLRSQFPQIKLDPPFDLDTDFRAMQKGSGGAGRSSTDRTAEVSWEQFEAWWRDRSGDDEATVPVLPEAMVIQVRVPIEAPCPQCPRHADPMHARK